MSTIEVINATPTDWAAVVSAAATGAAAIAGIAGTYFQAAKDRRSAAADLERSLNAAAAQQKASFDATAAQLERSAAAEDRRAIQTQKIRIYAAFQGAVDDVIAVASRAKQLEGEFSKAQSAMLKASAEVVLVAPKEIGDLAERITRSVSRNIVDPQGTIDRNRKELYKDMRADLDPYRTQPASAGHL